MKGIICLWSGAIVDIPAGWHLCDGNDGTPDLRNRFVVGAGDGYAPDDNDATPTHTHTFTGDGHFHNLIAGTTLTFGADLQPQTNVVPASGTTDGSVPIPPYYALAYIIKL